MQAVTKITELVLLDGKPAARILCLPKMIPAPGQYLQAYADGSDSLLAASLFAARIFADGFLAAPPIPASWLPGQSLHIRGPLGHGFSIPRNAPRVALVAWNNSIARLMPLIELALKQESSVVLVCETPPDDLPLRVEAQPLQAFTDVYKWADYVAMESVRETLSELRERLGMRSLLEARNEAQILIHTQMPCGALAACGVCAVKSHHGDLLICDDGPVFDLADLNL